jgi:hypothetical protein
VSIVPEGVYDSDDEDEEQEDDALLPAAAVAAVAAVGADVLCIGEMTQLRELHLQGLVEQHWIPLLRSPSLGSSSVRELSLRVVQRAAPRDLILDWQSAFANIGLRLRCLTLECCFDANRILAAVTAHCGAQLSRLNLKPVQLETRKDSPKGKDDTCVPGRAQLHRAVRSGWQTTTGRAPMHCSRNWWLRTLNECNSRWNECRLTRILFAPLARPASPFSFGNKKRSCDVFVRGAGGHF